MRRLVTLLLVIPLLGGAAAPAVAQTPSTTEASATSVRTDILPGVELTVEEVEPGVFRVVNDGVSDIASVKYRDVVAGHDGSIWLSGGGSRQDIVHLGSPRDKALRWPDRTEAMGLTVTQDGTVWRRYWLTEGGPRLDSLEDGQWTKHHRRRVDLDAESLTIAPDGTLWAGPEEAGGLVVSRLGADGWEPLSAPAPTEGELLVTPDGEVWVAGALGGVFSQEDGSWHEEERGRMWRYRWVDGEWQGQEVEMDAMLVGPFSNGLEIGTDGTVWFAGVELLMAEGEPLLDADGNSLGDSFLMRFDGTEWQRWGPADGVPSFSAGYGVGLKQAPDGGLWIKAQDHVARFDGTIWQRFLSGRYPSHWGLAWDVAPDGSVWLNALDDRDDDTKSDLYVITPEAVAAKSADGQSVAASSPDITFIPTGDPVVFEVTSEPLREWLHADERLLGPLTIDRRGGVWVQGWDGGTLYVAELGVPGRTEFGRTGDAFTPIMDDLAATADGTLWGAGLSAGLRSFDGEAWTPHSPGPWPTELADDLISYEFQGVVDLTEAPDGTLYGITEGGELVKVKDGDVFRRLLGNDWAGMWLAARAVAATPDGTIWIGGREGSGAGIFADTETGLLLRLDGLSSEIASPLGAGVDPYVADLAVAPDGALWALLRTADDSYLARYDGQAWTTYATADGLPEVGARTFAGNGDRLAVGPDGRVWFSLFQRDPEDPLAKGDGLVEFDGQSFEHYLEGVQVEDLAIARDGSVWTSTDEGLYVITPEAVTE